MVYIPGLGSSSFPGGLAGVPGADGAAGSSGTDAPLGGAGYSLLFDDFLNSAASNLVGWLPTSTGTFQKTTTGIDASSKAIGVVSFGTSTSTSGHYSISQDLTSMLGGYATFDQEWRVYIPTLSDVTNRYFIRMGLIDTLGNGGAVTDGVYFDYTEATSPNWRCSTSSNSSRTETVSSVVAAAGSFIKLRLVFSPTEANFYINGSLVVTTLTNLPTGAGRTFGVVAGILKTAGTSERYLNIDYHKLTIDWTVDR